MKLVITLKLVAESKPDAMQMPPAVEALRENAEAMRGQGAFGPPECVELRYLVVPGVWDRG